MYYEILKNHDDGIHSEIYILSPAWDEWRDMLRLNVIVQVY